MSARYELDEAVLAIQEATSGISSVSKEIGEVKGMQGELLTTLHALSERVSNMEERSLSMPPSKKQNRLIIPLYERVSFLQIV